MEGNKKLGKARMHLVGDYGGKRNSNKTKKVRKIRQL